MKKTFILLIIIILSAFSLLPSASFALYGPRITEIGNKHNLSYGNSGVTYKATDPNDPRGRQICIFCHTPHNAASTRALWNRRDTKQSFGHYSSGGLHINEDLKAASGYNEPNGSSRLCLSCHDGVMALGAVVNGQQQYDGSDIAINGSTNTAMGGANVFDRAKMTNSHHPVSFNYAGTVQLTLYTIGWYKLPPPGSNVRLDKEGRMQCTTCHDPHQTRDTNQPFWVWEDTGDINNSSHDAVCKTCHNVVFPQF